MKLPVATGELETFSNVLRITLMLKKRKHRNSEILVVGDIALVELSSGKSAIIDVEDVPIVAAYNWHFNGTYASACLYFPGEPGKRKKCRYIYMHKLIMGKSGVVDHANRDTLDNRKSNLRGATHQKNCFNRGKRSDNKSGLKGVSASTRREGYWRAQIKKNGKTTNLGDYLTKEEAHEVYCAHARKLFGEFAQFS